ncbi:hypothetical protein Taro_039183, partial [Colocasia esculenta]|nr:hypothetical protein [Colocasia esculenta]
VQKESAVLKGHTPRTCKKATLNSCYKSTHAHNTHCWQRTAQQTATTTVWQRTLATTSPYLKRVGGEPREQGSVGITSPLPARAAGTPTSGSKTTLQSSKERNAYHRVLQSSGTEKSLDHNPSQAKDDSLRTSGQHNAEANPRHTPAETKKLTKHWSNRVRPESHNTSTNIPDLHEVRKEQPGVTPREPSNQVRTNVSPQARPPQTSTRSRAHKQNHRAPRTHHEVRELHPTVPPRKAPRNRL